MFTITGQYLYAQVSCKMDVYNCYQLTRFYFQVIIWTSFIFTAESACTFPSYLLGQWTDVTQSATITFQSTPAKMTGWTALITGEKLQNQTCIHNTGNVFVFEGDQTVFDPFLGTLTYYMCMKITKVSDDVLYYYLLADRNDVADKERIYTANPAPDVSSTPTCGYCQFTQTIPDTDRRELRKFGTSETLTSNPSLCLPCEATCDETTTSNASILGPSSSLAEVTTINPSTIQTTPEASTPTISQNFTTEIITTTKVTPESLKQTTNGAESVCTFPSYLLGQWTDVTQSATITFQSTPAKMTGWTALITGEKLQNQTCIHNTGNVFVFEGDQTVFDPFLGTLTYYMCMKITKVSDDVLYYYLLADRNGVADKERIYTANPAPDVSSTPTCGYCQFTQTIPDTDRRELRKFGTSETLTSNPSLCLPCEATCDETTTSNASILGPSSSLTEVTTINPSTIQTTPEASTPTISQNFTTEIITTTKVTPESLKQTTNGAESACTFPSYLLGQWTDVTQSATITFQSTPAKMTGWTALITGETLEGQTCIHNTGNVFVFEGDQTVFDPVLGTLTYYMCMKITKVSDDVLYYYLLADRNGVANNERIYTSNPALDVSNTPTCDYCQFTQTIPDTDRRELRKLGTSETLTSNPSLCLPCESTCDETTTSNASTLGLSSSPAVVTTMNPSIIQTTPEASTPTILQHFTTKIITTTKVTPQSLNQTTNGAESACIFPSYLIGQWTDMTKGVNITFQSTPAKMTGWNALVTGEKMEGQTCIHNTGNVFVFEGDDTYHIPFSDELKYFMCMKITRVSDDVLYYYLLADKNSVADNERINTPNPAPDDSTTPTCDYCKFTSPIPDSDFRELRKLGTSETITSTPVLCLPCESTCEETTTSSPTTIVVPSAAITTTEESMTKPSSLLQTTTELSTLEKSLSRTTDMITQSRTRETSSNDIQQTTMDLSKLPTSTTENRKTSTTIQTTQTASVTEQKTSQTTSKFTTNVVISDTTTTDIISTYKPTTTTTDILTTPSKVVVASKDILITTDEYILTTQQEKLTTTAKSSGTGSIVGNNTEGLTESSILLITASSISGVLLGLAIITLGLCLIRNRSNLVKGRTTQRRLHSHRDRTRDYFNPL